MDAAGGSDEPIAHYECSACGLEKNAVITQTEVDPYCFSFETSESVLNRLLYENTLSETDFSIHYELVISEGVTGAGNTGNPTITYNVSPEVSAYDGGTKLGAVRIENPSYTVTPEYTFALSIPSDWISLDWDQYFIRARLTGDEIQDLGTFVPEEGSVIISASELGDFELELVEFTSASYAASLTLEDNIDINFFVKNLGDSSHPENYWVFSTFAEGQANELCVSTNLGDAALTSDGYKTVVANVYPYQMTQDVHITVSYGENLESATISEPIFECDYSVQDYFKGRIENSSNPAMQALAKAGLDYGANCQLFFNGKTYSSDGTIYTYNCDVENLANAEYNSSNTINAVKPDGYSAVVEGSVDGFSLKGASLLLGTEVSIKVYYNWTGDSSDLTVKAVNNTTNEEKTVEIVEDVGGSYNGAFYIEGIKSYELSDKYTLTVTYDGTSTSLTYSPYTYAAGKWDSNTQYLANLVKSLKAYGDAADTYFGY